MAHPEPAVRTVRTAVVTGAGSGIGRALARRLADDGARLVLADIDEAGLAATATSLPAGTEVLSVMTDVADRAAVETMASAAVERFGPIDLVVNNAGVDVSDTTAATSYEDLDWIMGINFFGVVHGTKAFLPGMLVRGAGTIVNVSSVFGLIGWPNHGAYCASKFAVRGYTEALRQELRGTGVTAIVVHPGGVRTNIVRSSRFHVDDAGRVDKEAMAAEFERMVRTTPEQAADIILDAVRTGRERCLVGGDALVISTMARLFPASYARILGAGRRLARR